MTRGDSQQIVGTLTPATGRTFATPIDALRFVAKRKITDALVAAVIVKAVGSGLTVVAQSATTVSYSIDIAAADTAALTGHTSLVWDLELTEGDSWVSTPIGGVLIITPDVAT